MREACPAEPELRNPQRARVAFTHESAGPADGWVLFHHPHASGAVLFLADDSREWVWLPPGSIYSIRFEAPAPRGGR